MLYARFQARRSFHAALPIVGSIWAFTSLLGVVFAFGATSMAMP